MPSLELIEKPARRAHSPVQDVLKALTNAFPSVNLSSDIEQAFTGLVVLVGVEHMLR